MLRIDVQHAGGECLVGLHGWLTGEQVPVFETSCASLELALRIELAHLFGADARGLAALIAQGKRGARLTGASPHIELLLEGAVGVPGGDSR